MSLVPQLLLAAFGVLILTASFVVHSANEAKAESGQREQLPFTLSLHYEYTMGSYGTATNLKSETVSTSLLWDVNEKWAVGVDVPYDRDSGAGSQPGRTVNFVRIGGKLVPIRRTVSPGTARQVGSLGDITAVVLRTFDQGTGPLWTVGAKMKFATASAADGSGTGKNDFSVQGSVINDFQYFVGGATLGYTLVGRVDGLGLRNTTYLDLDGLYRVNPLWTLGANLSVSTTPIAGSAGPRSASVSAVYKPFAGTSLSAHVLHGLSNASPKWGVGADVAVGF